MAKFLRLINGIPRMLEESASSITTYDDYIDVVASGASNDNEINVADASAGMNITLPNGGTYSGIELKVYLNGTILEDVFDYAYVGSGTRTAVNFTFDLEVDDRIKFRLEHT